MQIFPKNSRIVGIQAGEIRLKLLSVTPQIITRMSYVTDTNSTAGSHLHYGPWSQRTYRAIEELSKAMEQDFAQALAGTHPSLPDGDERADDVERYIDEPDDDDDDDDPESMRFGS